MNSEKIYFHHVRSGKAAITFAIKIAGEGWVQFSYALCSPKDQFNRRLGNYISSGRLAKGKRVSGFQVQVNGKADLKLIAKKVEEEFWTGVFRREPWIIQSTWLSKLCAKRSKMFQIDESGKAISTPVAEAVAELLAHA